MKGTAFAPVFWLKCVCCAVMLVCSALYVIWTWHWPLVGDSSLIHYICFLIDHGMAPYRDLADMNMPGSFLIEWMAMHVYGPGSLAWRLFDLTVLGAIAAGMLVVVWPWDRFAGLFSAVLFALIHGRDGIFDTGQRDLYMTALVVLAYAFFFHALRRNSNPAASLFGFSMAAAGTVKPTALPLGVLLIALLAWVQQRQGRSVARPVLCASAGFLLPLAVDWIFLLREQAVGAFAHSLTTVVPYFAGLGRRPFTFLLLHSVSPLLLLVILWLILRLGWLASTRSWRARREEFSPEKFERAALCFGALIMLAGYLAQGKGFAYQRYPFLALLLLLMSLDFARALRQRRAYLAVGIAGIACGSFFIVPQSLAEVHSYDWHNQELITMLQTDLTRLGGPALSDRVQCIDTISGCGTTLYRMRLFPASGLLSDFLIFGPEQNSAVHENQAKFLSVLQSAPPAVIVVGSHLFPGGPSDFQKLNLWPAFRNILATQYRLCFERTPPNPVHWWSHVQPPTSYRVYVHDGWPNPDLRALCQVSPGGE